MRLAFSCPRCRQPARADVGAPGDDLLCRGCGWSRTLAADDCREGDPSRCLVCGCDDLWRQKDFPARLGLAFVAGGALLSTVAWLYYQPVLAIGILMVFALADLILYALMHDVLVCYRCGARHRRPEGDREHAQFDLETAERYRQEARRLRDAESPALPAGTADRE